MFGRETIDRNDDRYAADFRPLERNSTNSAGDELNMNFACLELRQNVIQFSEPHQRLSANDGDMQWLVAIHQFDKPPNKFRSLEVADLVQQNPADVFVAVRIATRTAQRAFLGDLYRQEGSAARENSFPSA